MQDDRPPMTLRDTVLEKTDTVVSLILLNLVWALLTLLILPAIPALGALYNATNRMAHDQAGDWRIFVEGFRKHFWMSWRWGLLNVAVIALLWNGLWFYGQLDAPWAGALYAVLGVLLLLWVIVGFFTYPLLLEQSDQRLRTALRNSVVILIRRPLPALATSALLLGLIAASTLLLLPAWFLITGSLCTYLANRTVIESIRRIGTQPPTA